MGCKLSEEHPHNQVELVGAIAGAVYRVRPQCAELGGKQQIGTRPVDKVGELTAVSSEIGCEITWRRGKPSDICGVHAILPGCNIKLEPCAGLEFQLTPASNCLQPMDGRRGVGEKSVEYHTAAYTRAQAADRVAIV